MRLHVTYTGGTIGMVGSPQGLVPGADLEGWLTRLLEGPEGADLADGLTFSSLAPLIDSSNATPESWQQVVDDLRAHAVGPRAADGLVVLHGTDTMAYTSAALSYALTGLGRPVVVTGSQLPALSPGSDAAANVTGALRAARHPRAAGVSLFFGHRLLAGNRATKTSAWSFEGFDSPSHPPLARAGAPWQWSATPGTGEGWPRPRPYRRHDVAVVDLVPGLTTARLEAMLTPLPEAVILRAFGVGNVPSGEPGLTGLIASVTAAGTAVVVASQCHEARVRLGRYETGDAMARAGAVGSADMTLEAVYAKVQFLLSQGLRGAGLAGWVGRSIAGELTRD
ncbi:MULTISPECIES: asparaginase [unclassified Actinomyces]|uniref:asparaginase n=1 Tax=unclassified Actinomyces TaxID=2609248 RepID=UPI002017B77E|nr:MULTISPECIES: asparaginase [unclassified Actinomyces]MCL3777383.1 asparaginase [Actinomyces sp. AC-20-1]MCL3789095.1 asparaginase [Actinomyces sp. 187325]MCL3791669.1 asparaginase [Actinomyces sp. 186855]MCL3793897.1 asparaginase [Actinomyces sp. 217892]